MLKEYQNIAYLELSQISEFLNKKIIIYGAGIYATMLFSFFKMEGLEDNVVCFAVSDKKENHNFINGKPVMSFDAISINYDKTMIIIAMNLMDCPKLSNILDIMTKSPIRCICALLM